MRRELLYDESEDEAKDIPMEESIENLEDTSVSNPFFQITTRFQLLSQYVKSSATLPHVQFILGRSTLVQFQLHSVSFLFRILNF